MGRAWIKTKFRTRRREEAGWWGKWLVNVWGNCLKSKCIVLRLPAMSCVNGLVKSITTRETD